MTTDQPSAGSSGVPTQDASNPVAPAQATSAQATSAPTTPTQAQPRQVIFVCWGNICRSPMAERVARKQALVAGLTDVVFTSAATSTDEIGHPIDPRGRRVLERAGYEADGHSAHQITTEEIAQAELVVVMEQLHIDLLLRRAPQATNLVLLTDFDPAHRGEPVDDPWFGPDSAFDVTLAAIESALPGLFDYLKNPSGLAEAV